ncbi:SdpI family protein [Lactobacillus helveticus]|uniref:SdpI family protein n=1 Tax=Lactobacillus TaxID=1578 RepID=UPI001562BFFA|nr:MULTISPECIES: SdpI family protein [Lactobacillus]MCO0806654.1 SdpI family protein [Lactobacillus helveticus]MCP9316722.1 SdpI family protein [Lactobacillus helveticus]MCT0164027.1 SdpI family protein [Lactobacillus helveticus]MCT0192842.1 SdpI family protein [Lactobacillus helveticus]MCT0196663.1 SdpI family protein [Lactobacillus helveticus]
MIYVACGSIMSVIGIIWLISPAKKPNRIYGYLSYLAQVNKDSFKFAQRRASLYCILFGLIQVAIGVIIHYLNWDRYFLIWLLTFYLFILLPIVFTEKSLKSFLSELHELPHDYVDPDQVKRQRTKGFRDR